MCNERSGVFDPHAPTVTCAENGVKNEEFSSRTHVSEQGSSNLYPTAGSTSAIAGQQAALKSGKTRRRILEVLHERGPAGATLWEVARVLGVHDHTISGRFTELSKDLIIERTGERRNHPNSGCPADVWRICGAANAQGGGPDLAALLGYPLTLNIGGDLYDRQELLAGGANESYPGVPYARRADTGGQKLIVRVELAECPGCGHRSSSCRRTTLRVANPVLALVSEETAVRDAVVQHDVRGRLRQRAGEDAGAGAGDEDVLQLASSIGTASR
jgi:DNA-binding Lrp family transcriptional regulator